jgi:hypothetical protein
VPEIPPHLEAGVIARCLIGRDATDAERRRYTEAVARRGIPLTGREARLWSRMIAHPKLYNAVDGALALVRPASAIRQRGYMMLAVLEASTEHVDLFLARERPRWRVGLSLAVATSAGAARTLLGLVVVAATR